MPQPLRGTHTHTHRPDSVDYTELELTKFNFEKAHSMCDARRYDDDGGGGGGDVLQRVEAYIKKAKKKIFGHQIYG